MSVELMKKPMPLWYHDMSRNQSRRAPRRCTSLEMLCSPLPPAHIDCSYMDQSLNRYIHDYMATVMNSMIHMGRGRASLQHDRVL